ncbi:hypothetical protein TNCV_1618111 [Trichonephila clavipes]|nr:hypothetical protein TNCV_1618111 [Trichonephila clavipes]
MSDTSSSVNPTPLAHADNQGEGHPRGGAPSQYQQEDMRISVNLTYIDPLRTVDLQRHKAQTHDMLGTRP